MTKTQYKPQGNRVLIEKIKLEEKTQNGIILPMDAATQKYQTDTVGIIKALGNSVDKTLDLSIGCKIFYAKHSQVELDEGILLVKDSDIQAIIHEEVAEEDELVETTSFNSNEQEFVKHSELVGEENETK